MEIVIRVTEQLSQDKITDMLHALRKQALIESSHFAVSSVLEIHKGDHYDYVCGVNVESNSLNRLSMHAEQSAITIANTYHGGKIKFNKLWVMGAPEAMQRGSDSPAAREPVTPCGHCRQIICSHAAEGAQIICVPVTGGNLQVYTPDELLPHAFSERNLQASESESVSSSSPSRSPRFFTLEREPSEPPSRTGELSLRNVAHSLKNLRPHVVNPEFKTSSFDACILKVADKSGHHHYCPGTLVQDPAFLTTEAIFAAVAAAVTKLGKELGTIEEVHLLTDKLHMVECSGAELDHLISCSQHGPTIYFHDRAEKCKVFSMREVIESYAEHLMLKLDHHTPEPTVLAPNSR